MTTTLSFDDLKKKTTDLLVLFGVSKKTIKNKSSDEFINTFVSGILSPKGEKKKDPADSTYVVKLHKNAGSVRPISTNGDVVFSLKTEKER